MPGSPLADLGHSERALDAAVEAVCAVHPDHAFGFWNGDTDADHPGHIAAAAIDGYMRGRGFRDMEIDLRTTLDQHYPPDLFPGPYRADADPGVRFVVKLREALAELPEEAQ